MNRIEKMNEIISIIDELKASELTVGDEYRLTSIRFEIMELRDIWENEKQVREFYRDLVGTLQHAYGTQYVPMTIQEISAVMKISIPKATKFVRLCVNRGYITEFSDKRFITGGEIHV